MHLYLFNHVMPHLDHVILQIKADFILFIYFLTCMYFFSYKIFGKLNEGFWSQMDQIYLPHYNLHIIDICPKLYLPANTRKL